VFANEKRSSLFRSVNEAGNGFINRHLISGREDTGVVHPPVLLSGQAGWAQDQEQSWDQLETHPIKKLNVKRFQS
jgi:hypothetical protein